MNESQNAQFAFGSSRDHHQLAAVQPAASLGGEGRGLRILEGKAILTNEDGKSWTVEKGDGFIIPAGFKGTWETVKKVKKHYVILLPKPAA